MSVADAPKSSLETFPTAIVPLTAVEPSRCAEVRAIDAPQQDAERLQVLGVCTGRRVRLLRSGDPVIVCVWGTRIGVSRRLAEQVWVEPCDGWTANGCTKQCSPVSTPR